MITITQYFNTEIFRAECALITMKEGSSLFEASEKLHRSILSNNISYWPSRMGLLTALIGQGKTQSAHNIMSNYCRMGSEDIYPVYEWTLDHHLETLLNNHNKQGARKFLSNEFKRQSDPDIRNLITSRFNDLDEDPPTNMLDKARIAEHETGEEYVPSAA